jgi:hypothetical protein
LQYQFQYHCHYHCHYHYPPSILYRICICHPAPAAGTNCHQPSLFGLRATSLPQRRRRENHSPGATPPKAPSPSINKLFLFLSPRLFSTLGQNSLTHQSPSPIAHS